MFLSIETKKTALAMGAPKSTAAGLAIPMDVLIDPRVKHEDDNDFCQPCEEDER